MGKLTTGIIAGTMIGIGAMMMMDPKTRRRTKRMRRKGMNLVEDASDWVDDFVSMYK